MEVQVFASGDRTGKETQSDGFFYWKTWKTVWHCFYFQISRWSDLCQGINNPNNGCKSQVTKLIQFKNLLSMRYVTDTKKTKTNNISALEDLIIWAR